MLLLPVSTACNSSALPCGSGISTVLGAAPRQVFLKTLPAQLTVKPCQLMLCGLREKTCVTFSTSAWPAVRAWLAGIWSRDLPGLLASWHLFLTASLSLPASLSLFCIFRFGAVGESPKSEMERNAWSHLVLPLPMQDYSPQYSLECLLQSIFKWLRGEGFPLLPGEAGSAVQ